MKTGINLLVRLLYGIALILSPYRANALPILEFEFLGSGQTVSPTDVVTVRGKLTNTGDPFTTGLGFGAVTLPGAVFSQYDSPYPPGLAPGPAGLFSLATNESIEWDIATLSPWPLSGNPGDPVAAGAYVLPLANITTDVLLFDFNFQQVTALKTNAADFVWTVTDSSTSVPLPGTVLLIAVGLILLSRSAEGRGQKNERVRLD